MRRQYVQIRARVPAEVERRISDIRIQEGIPQASVLRILIALGLRASAEDIHRAAIETKNGVCGDYDD